MQQQQQQQQQQQYSLKSRYSGDNNSIKDDDDDNACAFAQMNECHDFLDRFYMSRIGIRFLAAQYLTLRNSNIQQLQQSLSQQQLPTLNPSLSGKPIHHTARTNNNNNNNNSSNSYIGMICQETSPSQCVRQAAMDASMMCRRMYGRCPRVEITGQLDLTFPYIPTYLHYIVLELLKNALRATMEFHMSRHDHTNTNNNPVPLPPVQVTIADGMTNEDVVIKIADCGGGIKRSEIDQIWSYLFTTADPKIQELFVGEHSFPNKNDNGTVGNATASTTTKNNKGTEHGYEAPLAGLGYGLPISRSYCRYFGGDLDIISMEGYGTDAFIYLKRLGDSKEPVPI